MIYEHYFALQQRPFSIAPNPSFLYACGQYQEALAALEYGMLHRGGFVLLTGEVGTGKTTLCKYLLQEVPQDTELALILHPQLDRIELLQLICKEFGVGVPKQAKESELIESLTEFLLSVYSKGGYSVLIIDEAQHLDASVLELIRLLTNLETHEDKLLQIILLGQPELRERLNRYELRQLNQRFTARYHLDGLSFLQTQSYVQHRLEVAGGKQSLFSLSATWMLYRLTSGIPRLINVLADRCLMGCYGEQKQQVSMRMVLKASKEVLAQPTSKQGKIFSLKTLSYLTIMFTLLLGTYQYKDQLGLLFLQAEKANNVVQNDLDLPVETQAVISNPCDSFRQCWFGYLPAQVLSQPNVQGQIWLNQKWQTYQPKSTQQSGLIPVALNNISADLQLSVIKPNEQHDLIPWVRNQLEVSSGLSRDLESSGWQVIEPESKDNQVSDVYDVVLHDLVMKFQKKHGLLIDGILGPQTLISLSLLNESSVVVAQ